MPPPRCPIGRGEQYASLRLHSLCQPTQQQIWILEVFDDVGTDHEVCASADELQIRRIEIIDIPFAEWMIFLAEFDGFGLVDTHEGHAGMLFPEPGEFEAGPAPHVHYAGVALTFQDSGRVTVDGILAVTRREATTPSPVRVVAVGV